MKPFIDTSTLTINATCDLVSAPVVFMALSVDKSLSHGARLRLHDHEGTAHECLLEHEDVLALSKWLCLVFTSPKTT